MYNKGMYCPGCEVSWTAFPSKCCRNVATRAVRHILSCCSPFTSRGVKEGKGENMSTVVLQILEST